MPGKKALIIGVTYTGTNCQLNGCKPDAFRVRDMLLSKFGYKTEDVTLLVEGEPNYKEPSAKNIMDEIVNLLIQSLYYGVDEVYFGYSGHGSQVTDYSGDETDGKDEILLPCDYKTGGYISDDLLNKYFSYFPPKAKVVCLIDACHSGSMLDLAWKINTDSGEHELVNKNSRCRGDSITLISGCRDSQQSLDVFREGKWGGALTNAFLEIVESTQGDVCWHQLVKDIHQAMVAQGFPQRPQLTASRHIYNTAKFSNEYEGRLDFNMNP